METSNLRGLLLKTRVNPCHLQSIDLNLIYSKFQNLKTIMQYIVIVGFQREILRFDQEGSNFEFLTFSGKVSRLFCNENSFFGLCRLGVQKETRNHETRKSSPIA